MSREHATTTEQAQSNVRAFPRSRRSPATAAKQQSARKCKADRDLPYGLTRDRLPFVQRVNGGVGCTGSNLCHWVVKSTGDYARDCSLGREYANRFIPFLRINLGQTMLAWIVLDMARSDKRGEETNGIVIGFMQGIGTAVTISMNTAAKAAYEGEDALSRAWEELAFRASIS